MSIFGPIRPSFYGYGAAAQNQQNAARRLYPVTINSTGITPAQWLNFMRNLINSGQAYSAPGYRAQFNLHENNHSKATITGADGRLVGAADQSNGLLGVQYVDNNRNGVGGLRTRQGMEAAGYKNLNSFTDEQLRGLGLTRTTAENGDRTYQGTVNGVDVSIFCRNGYDVYLNPTPLRGGTPQGEPAAPAPPRPDGYDPGLDPGTSTFLGV